MAYVSWNGAKGVFAWEVYAGKAQDGLRLVGRETAMKGFETGFAVNGTCVQVAPREHRERKSNVACVGV